VIVFVLVWSDFCLACSIFACATSFVAHCTCVHHVASLPLVLRVM
jgi:hypothetical protein